MSTRPDDLIHGYTRDEWKALPEDERLTLTGSRAPVGECPTCDRARETGERFMPRHTASARCRSGQRNHCTCDTCF